MQDFTPVSAAIGGALIGLAASVLLLVEGRVAGISGILGGLIPPGPDRSWRMLFVAGLLTGGLGIAWVHPGAFVSETGRSWPMLGLAGLFVGFGTQLGRGCTSGHGVCGLSRGSVRSLVATLTFMGVAGVTVFLVGWLGGAR
jgi:uncharacterized membrane protein YedE/YeeE